MRASTRLALISLTVFQVAAPVSSGDEPFVSFDEAVRIAGRVEARIKQIKMKYPHLKNYDRANHFHINRVRNGALPGSTDNPNLVSISYSNGVLGQKPPHNDGKKRSVEHIFDPDNGIQLYVHFFKGHSRGNDSGPALHMGDLRIHVYVSGPAAESIRKEIVQELGKIPLPSSDDLSRVIAAYLMHPDSPRLLTQVFDVLKNAQVIEMRYESDVPFSDHEEFTKFARSLQASDVTPISRNHEGLLYPSIEVTFSRFYGPAEKLSPEDWLAHLKRPIEAGYELNSVRVVLEPGRQVKERSALTSHKIVQSIAAQVDSVKHQFRQLDQFAAAKPNLFELGEVNWPTITYLSYRHAVGANTKAGPVKLSEDWCALSFGVAPFKGYPVARPFPSRLFPRQGIQAGWNIESADPKLNKKFNEIVMEALKPLDAIEAQLAKKN